MFPQNWGLGGGAPKVLKGSKSQKKGLFTKPGNESTGFVNNHSMSKENLALTHSSMKLI
jgi:hypothetical protein